MKARKTYPKRKYDAPKGVSSFYGRHHDLRIKLKPEVSKCVHVPISDSYGASESLSAWRKLQDNKQEQPQSENGNLVRIQEEQIQREQVKKEY